MSSTADACIDRLKRIPSLTERLLYVPHLDAAKNGILPQPEGPDNEESMMDHCGHYSGLLPDDRGNGCLQQSKRAGRGPVSACPAIIAVFFLLLAVAPGPACAFRVLIDPGHDRQSPSVNGCACDVPEYVFNANLSRLIADELRQSTDITVALTHDVEETISLRGRARMTQDFDFLVSVHHDSAQNKYLQPVTINGTEKKCVVGPQGFCVYISQKNPYPEQSLLFARRLSLLMISKGFTPSIHHGEDIPGERHEMIAPGVYYYDNLIVLKEAQCPAVLLEAAVLTNETDEAAAASPAFQQEVAAAVREALTSSAFLAAIRKPDLASSAIPSAVEPCREDGATPRVKGTSASF